MGALLWLVRYVECKGGYEGNFDEDVNIVVVYVEGRVR